MTALLRYRLFRTTDPKPGEVVAGEDGVVQRDPVRDGVLVTRQPSQS